MQKILIKGYSIKQEKQMGKVSTLTPFVFSPDHNRKEINC